jgi:hypothetical protein
MLSEPKYIEVNNSAIFQKIDVNDKVKAGFWNIGMGCIEKLTAKISCMKECNLKLTKDMIRTK